MAIFDCVDFSRVERVERGRDVVRRPSLASVCLKLFAAAALAFAGLSAKAADSLTMADFVYTNKLQIAGYTGTETLQNFPVLVRISTSLGDFQYSRMRSTKGGDLAFFAADGTRLASEVDTWTTSGTSLVWVKLPSMAQGTQFYMCYRLTDELAALDTMVDNPNPWGDYVGVWHLKETGGSGKTVYDSTTNALDGTTYAGSTVSAGAVGAGRVIATDNKHAYGIVVDVLSDPTKQALAESLGTDFHASFWMKANSGTLNYGALLCRRKGDLGYSWMIAFGGDSSPAIQTVDHLRVNSDNPNSANVFTEQPIGSYLKLNDGVWKKVDVVWKYATNDNDPAVDIYTNGIIAETITSARNPNPVRQEDANIGIGGSTQDNPKDMGGTDKGRRFNGSMDEVRLHRNVVSADWVKAEYDTVNDGSFVTVAPVEALEVTWAEDSGRAGVMNVAWNAATVGGIVTGLGEGALEASIEGKFWVDGDSEPDGWTSLTNGLKKLDSFEITVPCQAGTTYNYKLRGIDNSGETEPITGTFTTLPGLAVTWAEKSSRAGVTNVLSHIVIVGGTIDALDSAPSITIEGKFWNGDETEPTEWTALGAPLSQTGDFSFSVSGLEIDHLYSYKLQAKGSNGVVVSPVSGTFTTGHGLVIHWSGNAEQPGVTNVAWNAVIVGGAVESVGDDPSCSLEGKFWVYGETEPTEWQTLGEGNFELGDFSVSVPNLVENTTYRYKLRATETDGSETPVASGTFTTPIGLAATWAGTAGVTNALCYSAVIGGVLDCLGNSATCTIQGKFWVDETEPTEWTTVGEALSQTGDFSVAVSNLAAGTTYNYKLRVLGANGVATVPASDSFTTLQGLTINWAADSGKTGLSQIAYDFVSIGGTVQILGEATSCAIQYKIWAGDEPDGWETLASGLGLSQNFNSVVNGFAAGTTYNYKLRALGTDGMPSEIVSSTFTTKGEPGEVIGSDYTHFFDDGTNAVWVANDFERYLPFTVTGYTGSETLTNFPVLVEVRDKDTNGFKYEDFYHTDGSDMAFVDEKGHIIPHEIDTWNRSGQSLIWVRLPEMKNGTKFTMCYRSPLLDPLPDAGNVFEKYVGVWHMNETQNGVVAVKDSAPYNLTGETHAESLASGNGRIGNCRRVAQHTGTSSTYGRILVFDHDDILRTGVGNVFTFSGFYKLNEEPPKWSYIVGRKANDQDRGWGIQYAETITDGGSAPVLRVWSGSSEKNKFQKFSAVGAKATEWNYWTFVYDGSVNADGTTNRLFHAYLNGQELSSTAGGFGLNYDVANDATASCDRLVIGGQEIGTGAFNGFVDEARYSRGVRSTDWIKAEYDSSMQQVYWDDADKRFVTKGTVSKGAESLVPVVIWERGANLPETIIDVSYAYVQFAGIVTYCGVGADECRIEYLIWADGEEVPTEWTTLIDHVTAGQSFSIPVTGLKQDMPYNFRIRAVNVIWDEFEQRYREQQNRERVGVFRTMGNVNASGYEGEFFRLDNKFVHRFRAGSYNFTTPDYATNVEIMVVAGGGGGGYKVGGGGGLFYSASYPVQTNTAYRIHVGEGGAGATSLTMHGENGEISYFALASDEAHPLIRMHGGGGGGSFVDNANYAKGADGASGGGGSYAFAGGSTLNLGLPEEMRPFGHSGGQGNDKLTGGADQKSAAGGGGGAGRAGLSASFDLWWGGGAGGVGVECSITGEKLFYGAGGGGGYKYKVAGDSFTKPGAGGSGIGGNAADVRNGIPATSGIDNTGAGGGGGSMVLGNEHDTTYWKGGDGGDGVVLIAYEAHGRDPISEEPRISMTDCLYTDERGYAIIDYRAYWAGIQSQLNDIYVLYSTVSEEDVRAGNGEMVKCAEGKIGVGSLVFTPPEKGHTYWVRLVSRKDANSYMYSDEIASFEAPAIRINGVTWTESKATEISAPDTSKDFATVLYDVYDTDPDALLYCYWSENRADLEGNSEPSGEGVHFLNVTDDIIENGDDIVHATRFRVSAALGLERNKQYYFRLALANEAGTKFNLSPRIMPLWTAETAYVVYPQAVWANHVVTADFMLSPASYDPASVELLALYSGVLSDIKDGKAIEKASVKSINLGTTDQYPHGDQTLTQFPLSSTETTNYFTRLALKLPDGKYVYSARYQEVNITTHIPENTILITARAIPQKRCYGDEPPAFTYEVTYAGYTNTVAWERRPSVVGELACVTITDDPADAEPVTSQSPSGQYRIIQNTLALSNPEPYVHTVTEPVVDPVTGEQMIDSETHEPMTQTVTTEYEFMFAYARARHTITNAVFSAAVGDISATYTGEAFAPSALQTSESGVRNNQAVSYKFRPVADDKWNDGISASYTDVGTHSFEFMATAANHEATYGLFTVKIEPAPLKATISDVLLNYNGEAQTPEVETNVTGLVNGEINPLTCVFRDEAGEWQADVPSFTNPGEYTLYFKVSAPNHADFVTNCTVTVKGWDYKVNMDGKSGYGTEIHVSDPGWLLKASGRKGSEFADDATRYGHLDEVCPNGLKLWQNYVIDRTDLTKRLVATVMQRGSRVDKNAFVIHFPGVVALQNTGLNIRYRLDKKLRGESDFTIGELSDKYEMNVPLGFGENDDSTGLYVFNMVLVPTNTLDTGTAVLASCATVGVMRVACANPNTVAAVPWKSMSVDTEEERDIPAGEVVNQNGLSIDDMIVAYNAASKNFSGWTNEGEDGWKGLATVTKNGVSLVDAETAQLPRGNAFWLVRSAPSKYFYLIGRYTGEDYEVELKGGSKKEPGHTLVANPTMHDVDLNDLVFVDGEGNPAEPSLDDRIVVLDASGMQTIYFLHKTKKKWGRNVPTKVGNRTKQIWTEGGAIPSGTGFWYNRASTDELFIKFGGAQ